MKKHGIILKCTFDTFIPLVSIWIETRRLLIVCDTSQPDQVWRFEWRK